MSANEGKLLTTFKVQEDCFGIDVMSVQEVMNTASIRSVPLAPDYVTGLINLRGQLSTAISLLSLLGYKTQKAQESEASANDCMSVVCKVEGGLVSLLVDSIGDVVEVSPESFEATPATMRKPLRNFVSGVYKTKDQLINLIDLEQIATALTPSSNRLEKII